ncbi:MAG: DegQ family serine endoprotease [Desulfobacterales bacterium]|nr:DegQ family serine endoprotease [Desulfobacterales bacterium]
MKTKILSKRFLMGKVVLGMILLLVGFFGISTVCPVPTSQAASKEQQIAPESFTRLAEKSSPAVVNIRAERNGRGSAPASPHFEKGPLPKDDPLHDFFDKFFGGQRQREFKQRSVGSGFIIDEDGYIVTNNHVVEHADKIKVILKNGREYDADIKGRDPNTDLALIKIKPDKTLPKVDLGDSDALKVGEWVLAIGNPFGLEHTVTAGIISAKGRVIGSGPYDDFIQTDASINPGNSGGPLINMEGKVVGINTAIIAGGQGIGFAIPVNLAKGIISQLKTKGEVTRGWLGVGIQDLTNELKEYYGIKDGEGVLVTQVFPGDPADKAGLKSKDIILKVNGHKVKTSRELSRMIAEARVGQKVEIIVLRKGSEKNFDIELSKRKDTELASGSGEMGKKNEFGIAVSNLTPETARQFNLKEAKGVLVVGVEPDSKGEKAGILPGDIIREINHEAVDTVDEYSEEIGKIKSGETVYMYILRANRGFMVIKLTK